MNQFRDKTKVFINSLIVSIATVLEKFIFIIINIIVARYLNIHDYGEYTTALGYATFFSIFTTIGINQALIRAVNLDSKRESAHFGNTLLIKTVLSIVVYGVMTLSLFFTRYNSNTIFLTFILGLVRIGNEYMITFYSFYDAKERFLTSSVFTLSFSLSFLTATTLVILLKGNYFHLAYVRLLVVVIVILVLIIFALYNFRFQFDRNVLKEFIINTIPFGLYNIYNNFLLRVNIIILSIMQGTVYSGIFNNAYIFFYTLSFVPLNFNRILVPFLYKVSFQKDSSKFQFTFNIFSKMFAIISFYLFIILFLFSGDLIIIFFGIKYTATIGVLKILSFSIPFLFNIAVIIITALDEQKYNTRFFGIGTIVNIISNFIFIYFYKAEGAAMATLLTFITIFILSHYFLSRKKYISLKKVNIMYIYFILISIICYGAYIFLFAAIFWIYSIITISIIYAVMVIIFLIRKDDIRIIKETLTGNKSS